MSKVKTSSEAAPLDSYEQMAARLKEQQRAVPAHVMMGDREQAKLRKQKLLALKEGSDGEEEEEEEAPSKNRREAKEADKRE
jgi:hypothetical protein